MKSKLELENEDLKGDIKRLEQTKDYLMKIIEGREEKIIEFGKCVWGGKPIRIKTNHEVREELHEHVCRHVHNGMLDMVLIGANEGESGITGMCVDCIIEKLKELNKIKFYED